MELKEVYESFGEPCCRVINPDHGKNGVLSFDVAHLRKFETKFQVPDNELGVMTVAKALGFGFARLDNMGADSEQDLIDLESYLEFLEQFGIFFKESTQRLRFTQPVLLLSANTLAYREIGGGMMEGLEATIELVSRGGDVWMMSIYRLEPGMPDGWALVQSLTSCATVRAEKHGETWTITLTMPILPTGKKVGAKYKEAFDTAKAYYHQVSEML